MLGFEHIPILLFDRIYFSPGLALIATHTIVAERSKNRQTKIAVEVLVDVVTPFLPNETFCNGILQPTF